jgi:hypothetical protein
MARTGFLTGFENLIVSVSMVGPPEMRMFVRPGGALATVPPLNVVTGSQEKLPGPIAGPQSTWPV